MTLHERLEQLRKAQAELGNVLTLSAQNATLRAIQTAVELTPPTMDDLSGTNTRTGALKQHWATDSDTTPTAHGGEYQTILANDEEYASYVNDGHRMDRHFVPGLVINPTSGLLEYNPDGKGGIVVGTKTPYVTGIFMVDKAKETYRSVLREELEGIWRGLE